MLKNSVLACLLLSFLSFAPACAHSVDDAAPPAPTNGDVQLAANCFAGAFANSGLHASACWQTEPSDSSDGSLLIKFASGAGLATAPQGEVAVKLWMPDMGHGSARVNVARIDSSTYQATQIQFVMHGKWQIHLQLKNGATVTDEIVWEYFAR